jgi:phage tail sheath protein FI
MPEYLAPGVYLEEVDSSAKPIEGVSTSTAGMVGMAERGPLDVPILVTSMGEYDRWFGGSLAIGEFGNHCFLPHAVEGFFGNSGKRLYVVRVAPAQASPATAAMFWRDPSVVALGETVLLRGAGQGSGMGGLPIPNGDVLYVLSPTGLATGNRLRVGDGSASEYLTIGPVQSPVTQHITLNAPVRRAHARGSAISEHALTALAAPLNGAKTLGAPAVAGATELLVATANNLLAAAGANQIPWLVQLTLEGMTDLVVAVAVAAAGPNQFRLTLSQPLQRGYPLAHPAVINQSAATGARVLATDAMPGDLIIFADVNPGAAAVVELDRGTPNHEAFLAGALATLSFAQPLPFDAPIGTLVEQVAIAVSAAVPNPNVPPKLSSAAVAAGARTLALTDRANLAVGDVLQIDAPAGEEYATIVAVPGERGPAPDAGAVTLSQPLVRAHPTNAPVTVQAALTFPGTRASGRTLLAAEAGAGTLLLTGAAGWVAGEFARITTSAGDSAIVRIAGPSVAAAPATVQVTTALQRSHPAGSPAVERQALFDIRALDVGSWGDRLSVSAMREGRGLGETHALVLTPPLQFTVESLTGFEPGSLIELRNPDNGATALLKVRRIDRANNAVILDPPGLTAAVLAGLGAIINPIEVRSLEFALTVNLRRRPDPAVPSRNTLILQSESFRNLSLDHRHSRYFQRVIGDINGTLRLEDNRPEGESAFIRVSDSLQGVATEAPLRTGPEMLIDVLPGGLIQHARHGLTGGDDSLPTMTDAAYLGADNAEPRLRTGLTALRNLPEISLVAIPGQTSAFLHAGLISHCEEARYRFAILDAESDRSSIADVRQQRQRFDTKYAALYYPWLTIPDPLPANLANIGTFALPPSGHVLGLIARVDVERGVHKAPANEVVRGITGLQRTLQKGEHDILNPSPTNINVIRDFRPDGRGIRLFGARCITSDQEHKYVNVRRLLIFLERSIEQGLQWVVFEPNAEPLWARVSQSVTNFLTDVWRAGALEGTEPGQGFFVKCDLTTMTQSDIDNGRLICVIGVAPVKPAEFVIIRIGLTTRITDSE